MQIIRTSLQADKHASTFISEFFLQAVALSDDAQPTVLDMYQY